MATDLGPWKATIEPGLQQRMHAMADELARQSANLSAAEYRWLKLLGEFDQLGGWVGGGVRSLAHWLSWACGVAPAAAREKVRVARALRELPAVSAAFEAGRLSYSKVRAITRVATPRNEELLVGYGERSTAAQLEKVLRGYRGVTRADDAKDATEMFECRSLRHWVDADGYVRISAKLPPDDGALVIAELERLAQSGGEEQAAEPAPGEQHVTQDAAEAGRGDAPVASPRWLASPPIEARRADALRMMAETAAANGPAALVGGERHLVVVNTPIVELETEPDGPLPEAQQQGRFPQTDVSAETSVPVPTLPQGAIIEGVGRIAAATARRLSCDATIVALVEDALGRPLGVGRQSRTVPRWLRRALRHRDGGCCQFPGCTATRFVDAHHIKHWADDGQTDLDNLILLCRFHHRLVHEAGYEIVVEDGGTRFTFLRPDGTVVPQLHPVVQGDPAAVEHENAAHDIPVEALTSVPDWDGTTPDYSLAVGHLLDLSTADVSAETSSAVSVG